MRRSFIFAAAMLVPFEAGACVAATAEIAVSATTGEPAPQAVVELIPESFKPPLPSSSLPEEAIIDQKDETFVPLVSIIRRGGHVLFRNSDRTMHQVYSFSSIKKFAFEIQHGKTSPPLTIDTPGVAAIGCNIHDHMVTFVYVAETPWAAIADATGHAQIRDIPRGTYRVHVWHPQLVPGTQIDSYSLTVAADNVTTSFAIPLLASAMPRLKRPHSKDY